MRTDHVRAGLDQLKARIANTTPTTVLTNPNHVRDTALQTADMLAQVLDHHDQLDTYVQKLENRIKALERGTHEARAYG